MFFTFLLSYLTPGDAAQRLLDKHASKISLEEKEKLYSTIKTRLGLDLPVFYFDIHWPKCWNIQGFKNDFEKSEGLIFFLPEFIWNGENNRFHRWFVDVVTLNLGQSFTYNCQVSKILFPALANTLWLCFFSVVITYSLSVYLGILFFEKGHLLIVKLLQKGIYLLNSLPVFWMATLLIFFLAGGDYLNMFPAFGLGDLPDEAPFFDRLLEKIHHLILPVFCYSYVGISTISRQISSGISQEFRLNYVQTAFSKGLSFKQVIYRHVLKNSLLPVIAIFSSSLPYLLGGAIVIEHIFSINGIGKLAYDSFMMCDYPVIYAITLISALVTTSGNLVSDILIFKLDPRISISGFRNN